MDCIKTIHKYRFIYKRFFKINEFDIRAFSLTSAIEKFYAIFPKCKIVSIDEVTE